MFQYGKSAKFRCTAVRETCVSRHLGKLITGPLKHIGHQASMISDEGGGGLGETPIIGVGGLRVTPIIEGGA